MRTAARIGISAAFALAGGGGAAAAISASAALPGGCGAASQGIVAADYEATTRAIYQDELDSPEVTNDQGHVTSALDLSSAVASLDVAATVTATTRIVFTPIWHIVRLRVVAASGRVLADVGGPYVLAPVAGQIADHGRIVGRFILSVQDDLGYEKLVTRFTGLPIELYRNGRPLMGRNFPRQDVPSALPPEGSQINVGGVPSSTSSYAVNAFPAGKIRVLLAIPRPDAKLRLASCPEVNAQAFGAISVHLARLINLRTEPSTFVALVHEFDPRQLTFVRAGSTQLASSNDLPGPPSIRSGATVNYDGQTWLTYTFAARRGVQVSVLFPGTLAPGGSSGPTGTS